MENETVSAFAGIDWATDDHSVCIVDGTGRAVAQFTVDHTAAAGLQQRCAKLRDHDVSRVAIERPDGPVVDALIGAGFEVVVFPSRSVKAFRERYALSGSKSDRGDALVLADCSAATGTAGRPCSQTLQQPSRSELTSVLAGISSRHGSRWRTSCERTS